MLNNEEMRDVLKGRMIAALKEKGPMPWKELQKSIKLCPKFHVRLALTAFVEADEIVSVGYDSDKHCEIWGLAQ